MQNKTFENLSGIYALLFMEAPPQINFKYIKMDFPGAARSKESPCQCRRCRRCKRCRFDVWGQEGLLEKEIAHHFSILAWNIPWAEEPGGLQVMGPQSWMQLSNWRRTHTMYLCSILYAINNVTLLICSIYRTQVNI